MAWRESEPVEIEYPNRAKAASKATRVVVLVLLVAAAALLVIISIGGWSVQSQWKVVSLICAAVYLLMAFYVLRWKGGVLPVAAALALIFAIFAVVSVPAWMNRTNPGLREPTIDAGILGTLTVILAVVQVLLIIAAMRGFLQAWNVEIEHRLDEHGQRVRGGSVAVTA
jgi:uncharacterized membrane protein SirB2